MNVYYALTVHTERLRNLRALLGVDRLTGECVRSQSFLAIR